MSMQTKRGTKRTCQNKACGARFYDLMRDPITCPICHATFLPPPARSSEPKAAWKTSRSAFHHLPIVQPAPVVAAEEEAAKLDSDEPAKTEDTDTVIATEKPDLILELDEEDDDEVNVVEMPVTGDEKG